MNRQPKKKNRNPSNRANRIVGVFHKHPKGYGYVVPDFSSIDSDKVRVDRRHTGGAMPGDRVSGILKRRGKRGGKMLFVCEVAEVLERESTLLVGTLGEIDSGMFLFPDGKKQKEPVLIRYEAGKKGSAKLSVPEAGDKVVAKIVQYPMANLPAVAEPCEILGKAGTARTETLALMRIKKITAEFPDEATKCAGDGATKYSQNIASDKSFQFHQPVPDETIITIDPKDARDFDDAVSVVVGEGGTYRLGVHIADVAQFVIENSALDLEARRRGSSIYFPGTVVPMLPEVLSSGVCSLREGEKRLAKTVYITFDSEGSVQDARFQESVIVSKKRLTYEQAESIRKGNRGRFEAGVVQTIHNLEKLARKIERRRQKAGMLHLDLKEVQLLLGDAGTIVDVKVKQDLYTHKMIEMFMVEANEAVARLMDGLGVPFLSRVHPKPDPESLNVLRSTLAAFGHEIAETPSRKTLQALIDSVRGEKEEYAVNLALLRSLSQATYAAVPDVHYALASSRYCHFTSPIRRYPDLVVHRILEKHCRSELVSSGEREAEAMGSLAAHCSEKERDAKDAEGELRQVFVLLFLEKKVGEEFEGVVTGAAAHGLFVQLTRFICDGLIRFSDLGDEWFDFSKKTQTVRGEHTGKTYRLGQVLRVRIESVDVSRRHLNLVPAV